MKSWLLRISITIVIISIMSLILPNGKLSKYIKSIFSLIITLVIIQPLFNFKETQFILNFNDSTTETLYQEQLLEYISNQKIKTLESKCKKEIENLGVKEAKVDIQYLCKDGEIKQILKVEIDLSDSVIISDKTNINIIEEIKNVVSNYLSIDSNVVVIYE